MTHEELRIAADTVIGIENEIICEGESNLLELYKILSDKNLTPTARNNLKLITYPALYGGISRESMVIYTGGCAEGSTRYLRIPKSRPYIKGGSRYRHKSLYRKLSTRTKKGYGKGRVVIRTVRKSESVSKNSIDNLTWLV